MILTTFRAFHWLDGSGAIFFYIPQYIISSPMVLQIAPSSEYCAILKLTMGPILTGQAHHSITQVHSPSFFWKYESSQQLFPSENSPFSYQNIPCNLFQPIPSNPSIIYAGTIFYRLAGRALASTTPHSVAV